MCRLLGMISEKSSNINFYFFDARKPFKSLSQENPHGFGIGCHEDGRAKVFKQGIDDFQKYDFEKVREVASNAIIAHLRKTSVGNYSTMNAQPFQCNNWIFAHNGRVERDLLLSQLNDSFKSRIVGEMDSEVYFLLLMQKLEEGGDVIKATKETLKVVKKGKFSGLNFLLTDGIKMYAYRDAKIKQDVFSFFYTTPGHTKDNKSVVFCSEKLTDEEWTSIDLGQLVIVDSDLNIEKIMLGM